VTPIVSEVKFFREGERGIRAAGYAAAGRAGAIAATMLLVQRIAPVGGAVAFGAAIVAVVAALLLAMRFSGAIVRDRGATHRRRRADAHPDRARLA